MTALRSFLFAVGQWLAVLVWTPVSLAAWPLPPKPRARVIAVWSRFALWWLRVTCGIDHRVEGRERLPREPAVVLSKHQSAWETLAFQQIFPPQAWVLKRELLWIPFFGWGLAASRPVAIDRHAGRRALDEVVRQGRERLAQGLWVVVFPEGTRMAPAQRGHYNPGGAMLAVRAGVPVVPVALNSGDHWPRRSFLKRPGTITVVIGPPIDTRDRKPRDVSRQAEEWIESNVARISRAYREAAGGQPEPPSSPSPGE